MRSWPVVLVGLTCVLGSCAGGTTSRSAGGGRRVITPEAVDEVRVDVQNAYQAIQRLRPNWLHARATTAREPIRAVVYLNGRRFGDLDSLRRIPIVDVRAIRFISARDATTWYGTGHAGGVVAVTTGR